MLAGSAHIWRGPPVGTAARGRGGARTTSTGAGGWCARSTLCRRRRAMPERSSSGGSSSSGARQRTGGAPQLPEVDWSRYHLQVLFIDNDDVLRGRLAAALFERVAEWNGHGRVLCAWTCGVEADQGARAGDLSTAAALMFKARALGLRPKAFARPTERFEAADLDRHDVIVAVDAATKDAVLRLADPRYRDYYEQRVALLTDYAPALKDAALLRKGGLAPLPRDISSALAAAPLRELRALVGVPRPADLRAATPEALAEWDAMVAALALGAAGLAAHLIDSYPPDLPEYDPL